MAYEKKVLDISNPIDARLYIEDLRRTEIPDATWIETDTGKHIVFDTMTDREAVTAAHLLHDIVIRAGKSAVKH